MQIQQVAFSGRKNVKPIEKRKNKKHNKAPYKEGRLKKTLLAMSAIAMAGISLGALLYKQNTKRAEEQPPKTDKSATGTIKYKETNDQTATKKAAYKQPQIEVTDIKQGPKQTNEAYQDEIRDENKTKGKTKEAEKNTAKNPKIEITDNEEQLKILGLPLREEDASLETKQKNAAADRLAENLKNKTPRSKKNSDSINILEEELKKNSEGKTDKPTKTEKTERDELFGINVEIINDLDAPKKPKVAPWQEAQDDFHKKVMQSAFEYKQRMYDELTLSDRIKMIKYHSSLNGTEFSESKIRRFQLSFLSNEQMNALKDNTLKTILNNADSKKGKLKHMKFFKSLSPEQLIKIQESKGGLSKFYYIIENDTTGYDFDCIAKFLTELSVN